MRRSEHEIECLYCSKKVDGQISIHRSVDLMKKHLKDAHPTKPQI